MEIDLFDFFLKDKEAESKWGKLSRIEKQLVNMKFILAMLEENEYLRVTRQEDQVLEGGNRISILLFELALGSFVFAMPRYTDSALVLIDFDLVDGGIFQELNSEVPFH